MSKKKLIIIPIVLVLLSAICYLLIRTVANGGFEKELITEFSESQERWKDIKGPLLTTRWKQDSEFAKFVPGNELLGCWSVAFGQVLAFHQLQPKGNVTYNTRSGITINEDLTSVNWEKIVPFIDNNTPAESSSETAK